MGLKPLKNLPLNIERFTSTEYNGAKYSMFIGEKQDFPAYLYYPHIKLLKRTRYIETYVRNLNQYEPLEKQFKNIENLEEATKLVRIDWFRINSLQEGLKPLKRLPIAIREFESIDSPGEIFYRFRNINIGRYFYYPHLATLYKTSDKKEVISDNVKDLDEATKIVRGIYMKSIKVTEGLKPLKTLPIPHSEFPGLSAYLKYKSFIIIDAFEIKNSYMILVYLTYERSFLVIERYENMKNELVHAGGLSHYTQSQIKNFWPKERRDLARFVKYVDDMPEGLQEGLKPLRSLAYQVPGLEKAMSNYFHKDVLDSVRVLDFYKSAVGNYTILVSDSSDYIKAYVLSKHGSLYLASEYPSIEVAGRFNSQFKRARALTEGLKPLPNLESLIPGFTEAKHESFNDSERLKLIDFYKEGNRKYRVLIFIEKADIYATYIYDEEYMDNFYAYYRSKKLDEIRRRFPQFTRI